MRSFTKEILLSLKLLGELKLKEVVAAYKLVDGKKIEPTIRQMMYYLVKKDYIQKKRLPGGVCFYLTGSGLNVINEIDKLIFPDHSNWNMKWKLVFFDIPEVKRSLRDKFRRELKKLGFGMLQNGVWFTPIISSEQISETIKKSKVEKYTIVFSGKFQDFTISPELLKEKFKIKSLIKEFSNLSNKINDLFSKVEISGLSSNQKLICMIILRNRFRLLLSDLIRRLPPLPDRILPGKKKIHETFSEYEKIRKLTTQELFKDRVN